MKSPSDMQKTNQFETSKGNEYHKPNYYREQKLLQP